MLQQDIKTSMENQRQANKNRFEDPYFIKIGGGGGRSPSPGEIVDEAGVKIVKVNANNEETIVESPKRTLPAGSPSTK